MGACVVTIHDVTGKTMKTWFFNSKMQLDSYHFNMSELAMGTYFVKVQSQGEAVAGKLMMLG